MKSCSLVIITRSTPEELFWLSKFMHSGAWGDYQLIVISNHWHQENLDGKISRKKNLGVSLARGEYCLVCHADTYPSPGFHDQLQKTRIGSGEVICPRGIVNETVDGLTWAETGNYNPGPVFVPGKTYISGAAILGPTELLRHHRWNEDLMWGQGEDVEFSRRLEANGVTQRYEPSLIVHMWRSQ